MTLIQTAKYWLQLVGAEYSIDANEVHHIYRRDSQLKPDRDHLVFTFSSSVPESTTFIDNSDADEYDADAQIIKPHLRELTIDCYAEDGMQILESVCASVNHPAVSEILRLGLNRSGTGTAYDTNIWYDNTGRMVVVGFGSIIDDTEFNETKISYKYTVSATVRIHGEFEITRTNHLWDTITGDGVIYTPDDDIDDIDVDLAL